MRCRDVAATSKGVVTALQALAHYQHRSDAILVQLLGRSYGIVSKSRTPTQPADVRMRVRSFNVRARPPDVNCISCYAARGSKWGCLRPIVMCMLHQGPATGCKSVAALPAGAADVLFYVAGGAAAAAAGAAPLTRSARLPLIGVFGGALLAERCLPPRLHSILQAGGRGEVHAANMSRPFRVACSWPNSTVATMWQCPTRSRTRACL